MMEHEVDVGQDSSFYLQKISELEEALAQKENECVQYRQELGKINQVLEQIIQQMNQQLQFASLVQKKLSPTEFPHMQGLELSSKFVPGTKQGGDYFDMFELDDKMRFAVLLASSSGYGMSALLMSIVLKFTFRSEARGAWQPHEYLNHVIEEIKKNNLPATDHTSVFYGIMDRRSFEFKYAMAGEVQGAVINFSPHKINLLQKSATPLSVQSSLVTESHTVQLQERDRFVVASAGIAESQNAQTEKFGVERFLAALRSAPKSGVHELRNEVLYQLERFRGKVESEKDLAIIVCEIKDKVIKLTKK